MKKLLLTAAMAVAAMSMTAADYYLAGKINEWDAANEAFKFAEQADGTYALEIGDFEFSGGFKITEGNWDVSYGSNGEDIIVGEPYVLGQSGNVLSDRYLSVKNASMKLEVAQDGLILTLNGDPEVNPNWNPDAAPELYIRGLYDVWDAVAERKLTFDKDAKRYSLMGVEMTGATKFKIADSSWGKYNFGAGTEEETLPINANNNSTTLFNGSQNDAQIDLTGSYNFYVFFTDDDFKSSSIEVEVYTADEDPYAGVAAIAADEADAPAVYYNLQGVQVENPTNGLYIVKQGNKVSKIVK